MNWYTVYTRPYRETKVAETLGRKKMEAFCPMNRITNDIASRKKAKKNVMFPSFVFVRVAEKQLPELRKIDGVVNLVYWLSKPVVIQDAEMEALRDFVTEQVNLKTERVPVNVNVPVQVLNDTITDEAAAVPGKKASSIKLVLPSLGYALSAEVRPAPVEVFSQAELRQERIPAERFSFG